jgi:hypothetical protein
MEFEVNLFAVVAAAFVNMAVGFAWYSPLLLAKQWVAESGVNLNAGNMNMAKSLAVSALASLALSYVLAIVLGTFRPSDFYNVLLIAGVMWMGFVASIMTNLVSWEMKSWTLYMINAGCYLLSFLLMAATIHLLS